MKKLKNTIVRIDKPCNQNWEEMIASDMGRFCNNCKKTVTDFTGMSDQEIVSVIKQSKGESCGRFRKSQVNREIYYTEKTTKINFGKIFTPLLLLPLASVVHAQNKDVQQQTISTIDTSNKRIDKIAKQNEKYIIRGRVLDSSSNINLLAASIHLKNTKYNCISDENGYFQLTLPSKYSKRNFSIQINYVGYNQLTIKVQNKKNKFDRELIAYLHPSDIDNEDVVVIGGYLSD
jgi:hypothetical protein